MGQIGWLMGIITPAFPAMKGGGEEEARRSSNGERSVGVVRCGCGELLARGGEERRGKGRWHCCRLYLCCKPPGEKTMRAICLRFCFLILEPFLDEGDGPQAQAGMVCCLAHEIEGSTNH